MYVSLFRPRNPLTGDGGITVRFGCIGEGFRPRSPLTGIGGIVVKPGSACFFVLA